tara:strand:+ start:319 stop:675 length:357 start_codon:yes stop_codon:yes gene_type:complete
MGKLYVVVFTIVSNNTKVWKLGYTRKTDVYKRFQKEIDAGVIKDLKIWVSVWVKDSILELEEDNCHKEIVKTFGGYKGKFHNFWLKEMINGLTEMRLFNYKECQYALNLLEQKGSRYK